MRSFIAGMTLAVLLTAGQAFAGVEEATVRVLFKDGKCTGVCVSADGVIATAKHCACQDSYDGIRVQFKSGETFEAEAVWQTNKPDGPLFLRVDTDVELPCVKIAAEVPAIGDPVYSIGTQREQWETFGRGVMKGSMEGCLVVDGKPSEPYRTNTVGFVAEPGWSGGPVFNENDELVGLVLSTGQDTSICSWQELTQGFNTIPPSARYDRSDRSKQGPRQGQGSTKPEMMVFTAPWCTPCQAWKNQYYNNPRFRRAVDAKYYVTFHDVNDRYAQQYGFKSIPAFVVNGRTIHEGYTNERAWFKGVGIGIGPVGIGAGVVVPPRPFIPGGNEGWEPDDGVPQDDIDEVDWNAVTLVLAVNTKIPLFTEKRSANVDRIEQRIRQATLENGVPVNVRVLSRVLDQSAYDQFCYDAGVEDSLVNRVHPVVLVPRLAGGGLKGFAIGRLAGVIEKAVDDATPLTVISERDEELRYEKCRAALYAYAPDMGDYQGERFGGFTVMDLILIIVTALAVAKLNLLEMLVGFLQGIRSRINLPHLEWDR